ncbi:MAG: hypothetical protein ACO3UU_08980, partial [Minisyncoccia bacterium]
GDITTSGGGSTWTIDNNAVTNAKLAQVATATVKGRATAGTGNVEDLTIDADLSSVSANDDTIPSAKAVKAYVDILDLKTRIRNGGLINGFIRVTVASNNLTVAISTSSSSQVDPTASNPVYVWIGGTLRSITSVLSCNSNAGFNLCNSGSSELVNREIDYFVYIGNRTSDNTLFLGFSRIPYARVITDFSDTANNDKYVRFGDGSFNPSSTIGAITNIGRFAATLSAGPSHNWSVPAFTNANLIQEPVYETRWLSATLAPYGSGGSLGTFAQDSNGYRYKLKNDICSFQINGRVTNKGSWSGDVRITIPISAKTLLQDFYYASGWVANNTNPATTSRGGIKLGATNYMTVISNIYNAVLQWSAVANSDSYWVGGEYEI